MAAFHPEAQSVLRWHQPGGQVAFPEEGTQGGKRRIPNEDQGRGPFLEVRHDLGDARFDQRMLPLGLVAKQVVDEEVAGDSIQLAVEMERALPAPDVKMGIRPDARAPRELLAQGPEHDPLAASLVANRQLLRGSQKVVPNLDYQGRSDGHHQNQGRAQ
jgi:hypothetical protein